MLVTFSCSAYADIILFGDVAIRLLKLMGHSGTVPGAILAEDVETALAHLISATQTEQAALEKPDYDENGELIVSLTHRALPLIELFEAATKAKCNVMWDK